MKVLMVCSSIANLKRGGERFCLNLSAALIDSGHDVYLVTGNNLDDRTNSPAGPTFHLYEVKQKILRKLFFDYFNPFALVQFRRLLHKLDPDVIHFHSNYGISSYLVRYSSKRFPTVITAHDMWPCFVDSSIVGAPSTLANKRWKVPFGVIHKRINKSFFKGATLVSPSAWLQTYFLEVGFSQLVKRIPNGISLPSRVEYKPLEQILWVGALTKNKGIATIFEPVQKFSEEHQLGFNVVGTGPLLRELTRLSQSANLHGYADARLFYPNAQILLVSSICFENFPTVVLEGMAHGLCVVGRDIAGIAEIISDGKTGLLFKTTTELIEVLGDLVDNPAKLQQIRRNARMEAMRHFSLERCKNEYLKEFRLTISSFSNT